MLSVILGILKLLGLLVLIVSGVILLLLFLLLFVPFRYRGDGCYQDQVSGAVEISWLWRLLHFRVSYEDGPDARLKLLFIPLWRFSTETGQAEATDFRSETVNTSAEATEQTLTLLQEAPENTELEGTVIQTDGSFPGLFPRGEERHTAYRGATETQTASDKTARGFSRFRTRKIRKSREKRAPSFRSRMERRLCRVRALLRRAEELRALFRDKRTQRLLSFFQRKALWLGREIVPGSFRGAFRFGFDDPFLTGQLCSFAALLLPFYGDRLQLEPMFHQTALSGEIHFRGKLRLLVPAMIAAQTWFNRDFHYVRRRLRRASAEKKP